MEIKEFTGLRRDNKPAKNRYMISFTRPISGRLTSFTGWLYSLTWERMQGPCLYAGNRQAGKIYEVDDPNDSVIEGNFTEYEVPGRFETSFKYSEFDETRC